MKGEEIRILSGPNKDCEGWLDASNISKHARKVNIIVEDPNAPMGLRRTWAKKCNVGPKRNIHDSYWQALLYCAPDVEHKINTLAVDLAECQLDDIDAATGYLAIKFKEAVKDMRLDEKKGAKVLVWLTRHKPRKRSAQGEPKRGDPMEGTEV